MPDSYPIRDRIVRQFDTMSPQLQQAARYILDHPREVALSSMRELARLAGVQPATMTRLAQSLELSGYDELRASHAETIRMQADGLASRALHRPGASGTGQGTGGRLLHGMAAQMTTLATEESLRRIEAVAACMAGARRIHVLGLRSCHAIAWHLHYVLSLLGERVTHLDGPGDTLSDPLIRARADDLLLVISVNPYARRSLELAEYARGQGMKVAAITDSEVSPLCALSDAAILCPTDNAGYFHGLAPLLAVAEVLLALMAERRPAEALEALHEADRLLLAMDTYATAVPPRRAPD